MVDKGLFESSLTKVRSVSGLAGDVCSDSRGFTDELTLGGLNEWVFEMSLLSLPLLCLLSLLGDKYGLDGEVAIVSSHLHNVEEEVIGSVYVNLVHVDIKDVVFNFQLYQSRVCRLLSSFD